MRARLLTQKEGEEWPELEAQLWLVKSSWYHPLHPERPGRGDTSCKPSSRKAETRGLPVRDYPGLRGESLSTKTTAGYGGADV